MSGTSSSLVSLISHSDDELLRKEAYTVYCTSPRENLKILDHLVETRHEMAALMGFKSYAAYQLDNFSLAATPHAVETFLDELAHAIKPAADKEALKLAEVKRRHERKSHSSSPCSSFLLEPWDRDWAISKASHGGPNDQLARHFEQHVTLDGCLAALSLLLGKTLNIKLIEENFDTTLNSSSYSVSRQGGERVGSGNNELWAPGVRKLRVVDCNSGALVGIVYLDLYKRENKFPGAAHFTLRCGKKIKINTLEHKGSRTGEYLEEEYQTPVVALVANFRSDGGVGRKSGDGSGGTSNGVNLSHREVETFFHEFGHALNSLLSRTEYQHLSGTRGPQDVIEVPSHVFERFSLDYETMKMLVHLSSSGSGGISSNGNNMRKKGSFQVSKQVEKTAEMLASAALESKREFAALTLQSTLSLCAIDQVLHGENPPVGSAAEREVSEIMQKHNSIYSLGHGDVKSNHSRSRSRHEHVLHRLHPHIRFNHLIGYGSNYYCYLYAQCISSSLWEQDKGESKKEKTTQEAMAAAVGAGAVDHWPDGDVLRRQLLEPGGAKPAYNYISDLFTSNKAHDIDTKNINSKNKNNGMLVVVKNSVGEEEGSTTSSTNGWYPKFDSLLRHLGIRYKMK